MMVWAFGPTRDRAAMRPNGLAAYKKGKKMSTVRSIDKHPDILALRAGYERATESLIAQGVFGLMMLVAVYAAASP